MENRNTENFIELRNICFSYPNAAFSLENIDLDIKAKGITMLSGPNGSGKSTICKLITGILKPTCGSLKIDGEDASQMTLAQRGRKIGFLFQNPAQQIFAPEVAEELAFIPRLLGVPEDAIEVRSNELLQFFGLTKRKDFPTFFLSRGEKQRLAMAGILFMRPPFLILDEPTTGLDEENRRKLADLLHKLIEQGTGILLISHDEPFAAQFPDAEIITIKDGRIEK